MIFLITVCAIIPEARGTQDMVSDQDTDQGPQFGGTRVCDSNL